MLGDLVDGKTRNSLRKCLCNERRGILAVVNLAVLLCVSSYTEGIACSCCKTAEGIGEIGGCLAGSPALLIFVIDKNIISGCAGNLGPLQSD